MMRLDRPRFVFLILGLFFVHAAMAQEEGEVRVGTHVVREGETLEDLAAYFLGSAQLWRELYELNKGFVENPNLIFPGDEIRIQLPEQLPRSAAVITRTTRAPRRVREERSPRPPEDAERNDILQPLDILQTGAGASAEIAFRDHTSLVVTEDSRVVLGESTVDESPVERRQIEILVGQADLASRPPPDAPLDFEIVMGDAVVKPRPQKAGDTVKARTRRPEGRGAQVMVYEGEGDVEAAGAKLTVTEGMGTTVAEGEPPSPPEKLLDAPRLVEPVAEASFDYYDPPFAWQAVEGARDYTLEVCRDSRCGELEERVTGLTTTAWEPARLPVARFYWRVTATSPSGLDGFPSSSVSFDITADNPRERVPPIASVTFHGHVVAVDDLHVLGIGSEIRADVRDEGTGLAAWQRLVDGAETDAEGWKSPWPSGHRTASVSAVDKVGNRMTLLGVPFLYDPDPPIVSWGLEEGEPLGETSGLGDVPEPLETEAMDGPIARLTRAEMSPLLWTSSKVKWLPMRYGDWTIHSDKPFIVIRARKKKKSVAFPSLGREITHERGLWIHVTDAGCGVETMTYQLFVGPENRKYLVIEAADALDNRTRVAWPLVRD